MCKVGTVRLEFHGSGIYDEPALLLLLLGDTLHNRSVLFSIFTDRCLGTR